MGSALALEQNLRKDEKLMDERMDEVLFWFVLVHIAPGA
jgi:hypothetical protein